MAAKPLASGTVTFGLVNVPVRLYTAAEASSSVAFNLLHGKCGTRVKQQYVCPKEEVVVPRDEMVKGYEFAKDQFVTFTDDELKSLAEASAPAIEIVEFVPLDHVDPVFYSSAYYLGPDKGGERAYALLAAAMRKTRRAALAKWAARGKQHLVLMRPAAPHGLVMQVLHYATEVRSIEGLELQDLAVKDAELKLAVQLVRKISSDAFRPEAYRDEVRERYEAAIKRKVDGEEIVVSPAGPVAPTLDLMQALKTSLQGKKRRRRRAA